MSTKTDAACDISPSEVDEHRKETRIQALNILDAELCSLKKDARVYVREGNCMVFFRDDVKHRRSEVKKELESLMKR